MKILLTCLGIFFLVGTIGTTKPSVIVNAGEAVLGMCNTVLPVCYVFHVDNATFIVRGEFIGVENGVPYYKLS